MRRKIKGKSPEEIRELKREELDQPVSLQDFEEAIVRQDITWTQTFDFIA
jgi:katanin p60 ATPase-containing subunit A1